MDYMAFCLPVVAFDVHETRESAGGAAAYASGNEPASFASLIDELLADPERRAAMGLLGRERVENELAWDHQKVAYVGVFDHLVGK
jgi:glycosyltransferase involved in cell wall biosynthesis